MGDFFQELKYIEDYLNPAGKPAIVYSFSSDGKHERDANMGDFRARFVVSMPRNNPHELLTNFGLPNLYYAWGESIGEELKKFSDLEQRAYQFDQWLRSTPIEQIKEHLPLRVPWEKTAPSQYSKNR